MYVKVVIFDWCTTSFIKHFVSGRNDILVILRGKIASMLFAKRSNQVVTLVSIRTQLNEFAPRLRVIVACGDERDEAYLDELLPHSFGPSSGTDDFLGKD